MNSMQYMLPGIDTLTWFVTTLLQATVLACLVLFLGRIAGKNSVLRHSILSTGLLLIVIAPLSSFCLQQAGVAILHLPTIPLERSTASSVDARATTDLQPFMPQTSNPASLLDSNLQVSATQRDSAIPQHPDQPTSIASAAPVDVTVAQPDKSPVIDNQPHRDHSIVNVMLGLLRVSLSCLFILWIVGIAIYTLRWFVVIFRLKRIVGRSQVATSSAMQGAYAIARTAIALPQLDTELRVSEDVSTPMVVGYLRPVILVPLTLENNVSVQQMTDVMLHELAHIARRDPVYLWLQTLARTMYWAHPLVLRLCRDLTRASEEICDNYVLQRDTNTSYSRTLLTMAELAMTRQNPTGAIGVIDSGWSLTERIAGLLDQGRQRSTNLNQASKISVFGLALLLSCVLLGTVKFSQRLATAQSPFSESTALTQQIDDQVMGVRGSGDQLEFRLHGRLLGDADGAPQDPHLEVLIPQTTKRFPVSTEGDRYEVWLPAKEFEWFNVSIQGSCRDGRRATLTLLPNQLRTAIQQGADLQFQRPARTINFLLEHNRQAVADAQLEVRTNLGSVSARSNSSGQASIDLLPDEQLLDCTAWTETGLIGGHQFLRTPKRDPSAAVQSVELFACEKRKVVVVDTDGAPVAGLKFQIDVATAEPHFNFVGRPTGYELVSDSRGVAYHNWVPNWKTFHLGDAELLDSEWVFDKQLILENQVELVVKKPQPRVQLEGIVSRGGQSVAGLMVEAYSFQGESEHTADIRCAMADAEGKFVFPGLLPKSTYCFFLKDDRLASEASVLTPLNPETRKMNSAVLSAFEGYPVTITLTAGDKRKPIAGQIVLTQAQYPFTWKEAKDTQHGTTSRQINVVTDSHGRATVYAPAGFFKASVYSSAWQVEQQIYVKADQENRIELHRDHPEPVSGSGRLLAPAGVSINWQAVKLSVQSLDGKTNDELKPEVDASGKFQFMTEATALAAYAATADGRLAGTSTISDIKQSLEIALHPTTYLRGRILDAAGQGVAGYTIRAIPTVYNSVSTERGPSILSHHMSLESITVKTDASGNFQVGPLPRLTPIVLRHQADSHGEEQYLGDAYIELDEERPPFIHRLGDSATSTTKLSDKQRMESAQRNAQLGDYHVMAILADKSDVACEEFAEEYLLNHENSANVAKYMQVRFNTGADASSETQSFIKQSGWPAVTPGSIVAVALKANGEELGRLLIKPSDPRAKQHAKDFVDKHQPPIVDAQKKWDAAFALAKQTNRRVWVRLSGRYCGPCFTLSQWLDGHRKLIEKEFVLLKIDATRDLHGQEVANRIPRDEYAGIPFSVFYDADGKRLIDSQGPTGNIGSMTGYEGKRYFRKMLMRARQAVSDAEIEALVSSLP